MGAETLQMQFHSFEMLALISGSLCPVIQGKTHYVVCIDALIAWLIIMVLKTIIPPSQILT